MAHGAANDVIARLEAAVEADAGAPAFPALAEAHRRAGRAAEAERVARRGLERRPDCLEGGLVLGLALLDQGRVEEARCELEGLAAGAFVASGVDELKRPGSFAAPTFATPLEFGGELTDQELERAFQSAETDVDQVVDADRVAQQAMHDWDLALPEDLAPAADSTFATHTMADLLERQGDPDGASRIRVAIARGSGHPTAGERRRRMIAALERWLENLRGTRP